MGVSLFFKDFRKNNNLTQKDLANALGFSVATIKDLEASRTAFPSQTFILKFVEVYKKNYNNVSSLVSAMLYNDKSDPGYNLEPIYQRYLASRKYSFYHIEYDYEYKKIDGSSDKFLALIWLPHLTYYKMIIAPYNRKAFLKALKSTGTSTDNLISTIIQETEFFDYIKDKSSYKSIRFLLDINNKDDLQIYKAISKIKKPNIGNYASISFQLVDIDKGYSPNEKTDIYYFTEQKSNKLSKLMH